MIVIFDAIMQPLEFSFTLGNCSQSILWN